MNSVKLPVSGSSFENVRKNGFFYIDKTSFIEKLCDNRGIAAFLFTRPHHFGKSLNMSMLSSFFDISKDSRKLFEGLKIAANKELCDEYMNKCPTILVSFGSVSGKTFDESIKELSAIIRNLFNEYRFLLESDKLNDVLKMFFRRYLEEELSVNNIKRSLGFLITLLYQHYGKDVILLVDEYDAPLAKANEYGYYREMHDAIYGTLGVLKDNPKLMFGVVTGCLGIVNYSYFDTLNNVYHNTINDHGFSDCFGFTEEEVLRALKSLGLEDKLEEVREWCGGYRFDDVPLYCPAGVIGYLEDKGPKRCWSNPDEEKFIKPLISNESSLMLERLSRLLDGESIYKQIDENIRYDMVDSSDNIWSYLMMTGYLTAVGKEELRHPLSDDEYMLKIPNKELLSVFSNILLKKSR